MVEVTLMMEEEELKKQVEDIFVKFMDNPIGLNLYRDYFNAIIDDGSATLYFGPVKLTEWVKDTLELLEVVEPGDEKYEEVRQLVEKGETESREYTIEGQYKGVYLIQYF